MFCLGCNWTSLGNVTNFPIPKSLRHTSKWPLKLLCSFIYSHSSKTHSLDGYVSGIVPDEVRETERCLKPTFLSSSWMAAKHANTTMPFFPHCTLISISSMNILAPMIIFKDTAKHRKRLLVVQIRNPPCPKCWTCCYRNRLRDPAATAGLKLFATMPGSM